MHKTKLSTLPAGEKITILSLTDCWETPEGTLSAVLVKKLLQQPGNWVERTNLQIPDSFNENLLIFLPIEPYFPSATYFRANRGVGRTLSCSFSSIRVKTSRQGYVLPISIELRTACTINPWKNPPGPLQTLLTYAEALNREPFRQYGLEFISSLLIEFSCRRCVIPSVIRAKGEVEPKFPAQKTLTPKSSNLNQCRARR